jgi:hypothetical protein
MVAFGAKPTSNEPRFAMLSEIASEVALARRPRIMFHRKSGKPDLR